MIDNYLSKQELQISYQKRKDTEGNPYINIFINSDYDGAHKSRLFINEEQLAKNVKNVWPDIKKACPKVISMSVSFNEIDHYDDITDIYYTPVVAIKRGFTNPKVHSNEHGSIPKDWETNITIAIQDVKQATPIIKLVTAVLGNLIGNFDMEHVKKITQKFLNDTNPSAIELISSR